MPAMTKHVPGMLCWADLSTPEPDAARRFYTTIFDWTAEDLPTPTGEPYTMFRLEGKSVAGLSRMEDQLRAQGVPPHWMNYVAVKSADEAVAKAKALGAEVVAGPFDVFDEGRRAVLRDPSGAMLSLWQAKNRIGAERYGDPGSLCWAELMTRDPPAAARFYAGVFGWTAKAMPMAHGEYTLFSIDGAIAAGMMAITPEMGPLPPHWMTYFGVNDCDATTAKVTALGGRVFVPPRDIPSVGRFATLADPQGAPFSVLRGAR